MNKEELKLKAKVDEYFKKYMCVSFDKFIENWEELEQLFQDQNQLLIKKDKEIDRLNNIRNEAIVFIRKYIPFYDNDLFNNEWRLRKYKRHQKYTEEFINSLIDILELKGGNK